MAGAGEGWEQGPGARGPGRFLVAAVLVLVVGVAVWATSQTSGGWLEVDPGERTPTSQASPRPAVTSSPDGEEVPPAAGTWIGAAPAPVTWVRPPRMVYTGLEVLAWGPVLDGAAGAAFNPYSRRWRLLPEAPLGAREGHVAVWAPAGNGMPGEGEMIVLGGRLLAGDRAGQRDGAAFDPATGRWRQVAGAPMPIPRGASAAWTGSELIVTAGTVVAGSQPDPPAAAYDPRTDTWRELPRLPSGTWLDGVAWTGRQALALLGQPGKQPSAPIAVWDSQLDLWRPRPGVPLGVATMAIPLGTRNGAALWTRSSDGRSRLWVLQDDADRWTATQASPLSDRTEPLLAWTGRHVLVLGGSDVRGPLADGASYDTVEGQWSVLPAAPRPVARPLEMVWTGREAVVVGYPERGRGTLLTASWVPRTQRPR